MRDPVGSMLRAVLLAASMALVAGGCATAPGGMSPEEQVRIRAQERWDLLLAGRLEAAYGYLSPAQRSATSLLDYQRQMLASKVHWRSAQAEGTECSEEACTARVEVGIRVMAAVPGVPAYNLRQTVEEQWIRAENQWWFVPR